MSLPLLHVQGLRFAFPQADQPLFDGLSFTLPAGVSWLGGDEGRGKTTLLRLLAGRLSPQTGSIATERPLQADELTQWVAWHEAGDPAFDQAVVQDILTQLVPAAAHSRLPELSAGLALEPHLTKPLYQLSTGSRRKVFIAATLARHAPLALLDQPFTALDAPSISFLLAHFRALADSGQRALLVADYLPPEGVPLAATVDLDRQA
ncbi:MAG: ATP-binding cassette domain-containing protein [Betaproteobacteria bacterium]